MVELGLCNHNVSFVCRSLKLGSISRLAGSNSLLTRSCLAPLNFDHGFAGYGLDYQFIQVIIYEPNLSF